MGNLRIEQRHIRSLTHNSSGTSSVSIPVEYVRALGWIRGQKVRLGKNGRSLTITAVKYR